MRVAIIILLVVLVFILAILVNVLHFGIKVLLRRKGFEVSFWYGHFRDIRFLQEAIANEKDPFTKLRYGKVLYAYFASLALFLLSWLLLVLVWN